MTVDPNDPAAVAAAAADPAAAGDPAPAAAAAPALDVNAIADAVIGKLVQAAEAAPAQPAAARPIDDATRTTYDEMVARANDPTHPLHHDAVMHLSQLRRQGIDDEWEALGCGPGHPARALFNQNPAAYSGMPRFAFQSWENQELRRKMDEKDKANVKAEQDREAARAIRDSAPGMPSRSVGAPARSGSLRMTHEEFDRRVVTERDLDDKLDQGLIIFID